MLLLLMLLGPGMFLGCNVPTWTYHYLGCLVAGVGMTWSGLLRKSGVAARMTGRIPRMRLERLERLESRRLERLKDVLNGDGSVNLAEVQDLLHLLHPRLRGLSAPNLLGESGNVVARPAHALQPDVGVQLHYLDTFIMPEEHLHKRLQRCWLPRDGAGVPKPEDLLENATQRSPCQNETLDVLKSDLVIGMSKGVGRLS